MTGNHASPVPTSNELAGQRTELADDRTNLALTRTLLALDRTLMAWVRTATSLISFGFTIYKFFQALRESQGTAERHLIGTRGLGLIMIALGVGALVVATIEYRGDIRELRERYPQYAPFRGSPTLAVAGTIAGLGVLGFVMALLRQ